MLYDRVDHRCMSSSSSRRLEDGVVEKGHGEDELRAGILGLAIVGRGARCLSLLEVGGLR